MAGSNSSLTGFLSSSEPRNRTAGLFYGLPNSLDQESHPPQVSTAMEDRPNNWDFCDWRPSANFDSRKIKKGNQEREQEKERERERERERSLSQDSSPRGERKHRTPSTFPRTQVSSAMPPSQRLALANLKQQLSFSDVEEQLNAEGERNNERLLRSAREKYRNYISSDSYVERNEMGARGGAWKTLEGSMNNRDREGKTNTTLPAAQSSNNLSKGDEPDGSQIVGRLMQIRDYLKQASALREKFSKSSDPDDQNRSRQLDQVVSKLQEQEQKYLELLLKLSVTNDVDLLKQNCVDSNESRDETDSDSTTELEVQSDSTADSLDDNRVVRPRIEDSLGHRPDKQDYLTELCAKIDTEERESEQEGAVGPSPQLQAMQAKLESEVTKKRDEMCALKDQVELLQNMLQQREKIQTLKERGQVLLALQKDVESKLAEEKERNTEAERSANLEVASGDSAHTSQSEADNIDEFVPPDLKDLRQKLSYLKNLFDIKEQNSDGGDQVEGSKLNLDESGTSQLDGEQLQDKLVELQEKKRGMVQLLQELQLPGVGAPEVENSPASEAIIGHGIAAAQSASDTAGEAQEVLDLLEARTKYKKLQEVRDRLNQLRSLMQYYESGTEFIHGNLELDVESQSSLPNDYEDPQVLQNLSDSSKLKGLGESLERILKSEEAEGVTARSEDSDSASQLSSSLGCWADDPEVQEKVRRLRAAKNKLRKLQDLVAIVQKSPEVARALPDSLADLAAGVEAEMLPPPGQAQQTAAAISTDEANDISLEQNKAYLGVKMQQQRADLEKVMEERRKLLAIQHELQMLRNTIPTNVPNVAIESRTRSVDAPKDQRDKNPSTQVKTGQESQQVTFQEPLETVVPNEEVYSRMRQQRVMREELREKKKELENFMRKDRPRKSYNRNQDNQSDNVSYSNRSDTYGGASVSEDVTMATWGGSTAGNLESIEEDENRSGNGQEVDEECDDDGYPIDGIVQVEEEEEADDSEDHDTYTIEEDFSKRRRFRNSPPSTQTAAVRSSAKAKKNKSSPELNRGEQDLYNYNYWAPGNRQVYAGEREKAKKKPKKQKYWSDEAGSAGEIHQIKEQLQTLITTLRQSLLDQQSVNLRDSAGYGGSPGQLQQYSSQLQQQQFLLNINACHSQLMQQNSEMIDRLGRLERAMSGEYPEVADVASASQHRNQLLSQGSVFSPHPYQTPTTKPNMSADPRFQLQPTFPENFVYLSSSGHPISSGYAAQKAQPTLAYDRTPYTEGSPGTWTASEPTAGAPNPFRFPPNYSNQQASGDVRSDNGSGGIGTRRMSDDIPIQTIQAADSTGVQIPKLNLQEALNPKINSTSRQRPSHQSVITKTNQDVICRKFPTPSRAYAAAKLASQRIPEVLRDSYRPGLSADISGTAYLDNNSVSSTVSSVPGRNDSLVQPSNARKRQSNRSGSEVTGRQRLSHQSVNTETNHDVMRRKFPTPNRADAAATLAHQPLPKVLRDSYRPGLSADISGTAYLDNASVSSTVSSVTGRDDTVVQASSARKRQSNRSGSEMESDGQSEFSLFEALRETIYAEVATLISQNENRPHFLIDLFRELQMLNTDYLRQRALFALQNLITRYLTEDKVQTNTNRKVGRYWRAAANNSELTPSESLVTSDEDELRTHVYSQSPSGRVEAGLLMKAQGYDYPENAKSPSPPSTPTASSQASPFAQDSLGDTVIHLDKALQRMREQERKESESQAQGVSGASPQHVSTRSQATNTSLQEEPLDLSSSAQDPGSDGSVSDIPQPRINTQQLDQQIKGIMTEIIPVLKEHVDDVCSQQLLQYIRRLVLILTEQKDDNQFVRFFHQQLGSIVRDTLAKYEGRKMRESREDMLVDLSEILFNELAFFSLMQDLDDPKTKELSRKQHWRQDSHTSTETDTATAPEERQEAEESDDTSSSSDSDSSEKEQEEDITVSQPPRQDETESNEEEELGKARDDELASQMVIKDEREEEEDGQYSESSLNGPVKIELAPSETKPFTRIGSDEDDEGDDDEVANAEDTYETAVSMATDQDSKTSREAESKKEISDQVGVNSNEVTVESVDDCSSVDAANRADSSNTAATSDAEITLSSHTDTSDKSSVLDKTPEQDGLHIVEMNGEVEEEITMDDLPAKMTCLSEEDLDIRMKEEDNVNSGCAALLESLPTPELELAGDPNALREPTCGADIAAESTRNL